MMRNVKFGWRHFTAAPHRMLFFGGTVALVLSMLWWLAVLSGRLGLPAPPANGPPAIWIHAWLMVYGIFPFFVLGFLMTAFPRWIGAPPVAARLYIPVALALFVGYLLVLFGAPFAASLAAAGMALTAAAWLAGSLGLALRLKAHWPVATTNPPWAVVLLAVGWGGAVLSAWGTASGHWQALAAGPLLGLWGFLAPMVFVVAHRMLPFFAQAAVPSYTAFRPSWAPTVGAALFLGHTALLLLGLPTWLWLVDLPLVVLGAWLLWRWQPWRARGNPLLWALFAAFFWMPVALGLSAIQSLTLAITGTAILGFAPLHVLAIGFFTGMVMAMATRVSLGHAGRALHMDRLSLVCFAVLQLSVVTRLLGELPSVPLSKNIWLIIAATLWLLAWTPWAVRHGQFYWQPRVDGKPG